MGLFSACSARGLRGSAFLVQAWCSLFPTPFHSWFAKDDRGISVSRSRGVRASCLSCESEARPGSSPVSAGRRRNDRSRWRDPHAQAHFSTPVRTRLGRLAPAEALTL